MVTKRDVIILGLVSAVSLGGYLFLGSLGGELGFPLDDAWIHQTYARNLARAGEWSFVLGQPSAGLTAPIWALLLVPGHLFGLGPYVWTFILGWLVLWGAGIVGMVGFTRLVPDKQNWPLAGGILLVLEWHLVWAAASGMETLLFSLVVLAVLVCLVNAEITSKFAVVIGGLVGLSVWLRPEGITLLAPVVFRLVLDKSSWQEKFRHLFILLFGFGALFGPYLWFNRWLAGTIWPNTFFAKQAEYAILREFPLLNRLGEQFLLPLIGVGVVLLPGFVYLMIAACRDKRWGVVLGGLWSVGYLGMYALRLPVTYQHGRYAMPAMPVYFLWGLMGMTLLAQPQAQHTVKRVVSLAWLILIPVVLGLFWILGGGAYGRDMAIINQEMVAAAKWVRDNTSESDLIAAHDIGALGYFAERTLVDLAGLVSPDVIPFIRNENQLAEYLNEQKPVFLVTFPGWYPQLVQQADLVFQTKGQASLEQGGENMAVYIWP